MSSAGRIEIRQHLLEAVLGEAAGVAEVASFGFPVLEAAVVEGFEIVRDDEGDDAEAQAFFEEKQAADAAVAVLEGVRQPTNILLFGFQSRVNSFMFNRQNAEGAERGSASAVFCFPAAAGLDNESFLQHPLQNAAGGGLADGEEGIDFGAGDEVVVLQILQDRLLRAGRDGVFGGGVSVRQGDPEGVVRNFNGGLTVAALVGLHDFLHAGAVGLDQIQAVEDSCQLRIPANGKTE